MRCFTEKCQQNRMRYVALVPPKHSRLLACIVEVVPPTVVGTAATSTRVAPGDSKGLKKCPLESVLHSPFPSPRPSAHAI